eukprot:2599416-Rhodomonas_salina.2
MLCVEAERIEHVQRILAPRYAALVPGMANHAHRAIAERTGTCTRQHQTVHTPPSAVCTCVGHGRIAHAHARPASSPADVSHARRKHKHKRLESDAWSICHGLAPSSCWGTVRASSRCPSAGMHTRTPAPSPSARPPAPCLPHPAAGSSRPSSTIPASQYYDAYAATHTRARSIPLSGA